MKERFAKLIDLKSIVTFVITIALVIFTWYKVIGPEMFISLGSGVYAYFFNKKKEDTNG